MPIVDGETDGARLQDLLVLYMKQDLRRILIQIFPFFSTFRLRHLDENGRNLYNYSVSVAKMSVVKEPTSRNFLRRKYIAALWLVWLDTTNLWYVTPGWGSAAQTCERAKKKAL